MPKSERAKRVPEWCASATNKEERAALAVSHFSQLAKQNGWTDRVMLRKAINKVRCLKKVPLEPIGQSQFRRIFKKYERNAAKHKRADAIFTAIISGSNRTKAADS